MEQVNEIVAKLRERGHRLTPQRMAVLKTLIGNREHLSVEEIYERVKADYPMMGLATVYKTVAMLKEMGEITELSFSNNSTRYDGSGQPPHPHLICTQCKRIIDIEDTILYDLPHEVAKRTGYKITHYRLDFFGICPRCQNDE